MAGRILHNLEPSCNVMSRVTIRLIGWSAMLATVAILLHASSRKKPSDQPGDALSGIRVEMYKPEELTFAQQVREVRDGKTTSIRVAAAELTDGDLATLAELTPLTTLQIDKGRISDEGLEHLESLEHIEHLRLRLSPISDAGLARLARWKTLRHLNLPHAEFTDAGIAHLHALPRLELLRFGSPHVTDAALATIATFQQLKFLHLINVPITDSSLVHLEQMPNLQSFYVDGGNLTDAGIGELLRRCPGLHFHQDQRHHDLDPRRDAHAH